MCQSISKFVSGNLLKRNCPANPPFCSRGASHSSHIWISLLGEQFYKLCAKVTLCASM